MLSNCNILKLRVRVWDMRNIFKTGSSLCAVGLLLSGGAYGTQLPTNGSVVNGSARISYMPNKVQIDQSSDKAIIDWHSFSVGAGASVHFTQPTTDSATLNRVTGDFTSEIAGKITATGSVFLVNPNGIQITKDGVIDTANFVGSTLDIDNQDFLQEKYTFSKKDKNGVVHNQGHIRVNDGGYVALLGGAVKNDGRVVAHLGKVGFAGGEKIVMSFGDNDFLRVEIPTDKFNTLKDADGKKLSAVLDINGTVSADGGLVQMTVADASDILRQVISLSGIVTANTVDNKDGMITIGGGDIDIHQNAKLSANATTGTAGTIHINSDSLVSQGTVSATSKQGNGGHIAVSLKSGANFSDGAKFNVSGGSNGGKVSFVASTDATKKASVFGSVDFLADGKNAHGGYIDVTNIDGHIGLISGSLSATGRTQGGRVRVGGQFQGGYYNSDTSKLDDSSKKLFVNRWSDTTVLKSAKKVVLGNGVHINVLSTHGDGGTAILWSDNITEQLGAITATGKTSGGAVEISGKNKLYTYGLDKVKIGNGKLLLDPANITLTNTTGLNLVLRILNPKDSGSSKLNAASRRTFARSVAVSDDGTKIAIGAPYENYGNGDSSKGSTKGGAVYLFHMNYTTGVAKQKLRIGHMSKSVVAADGSQYTIDIGASNAYEFGRSLAMDSSGKYLAIGGIKGLGVQILEMQDWTDTGTTGFKKNHILIKKGVAGATITDRFNSFGQSVALSDDGTRLAVGANTDDGSRGKVYLFTLNWTGATPSFTQRLAIANGTGNLKVQSGAWFGFSVTMNSDGTRLVVGSLANDTDVKSYNGMLRGKVYFLKVSNWTTAGTAVTSHGLLKGENRMDYFGNAVAVNRDATKLIVGASGYGDHGAIYTYDVDWSGTGAVKTSNKTKITHGSTYGNTKLDLITGGYFGESVAMTGDGNKIFIGQSRIQNSPAFDEEKGSLHIFNIYNRVSQIENQLKAGTNVTILASNDITVNAEIDSTDGAGLGQLRLWAGRSILINQDVKVKGGLWLYANLSDSFSGYNHWAREKGEANITVATGKTISGGDKKLLILLGKGHSSSSGAEKAIGTITLWKAQGSRVSIKHHYWVSRTNDKSELIILAGGQIKSTTLVGTTSGRVNVNLEIRMGKFTNNSDSNALSVASGRYMLWTVSPHLNKMGGIVNYGFSKFNMYQPYYPRLFAVPTEAGNTVYNTTSGLMYSKEVRYDLTINGSHEKQYDWYSWIKNASGGRDLSGRTVSLSNTDAGGSQLKDNVYITENGYKGDTNKYRDLKITIDKSKLKGRFINSTGMPTSDVDSVKQAHYYDITTKLVDGNNKPVFGLTNTHEDNVHQVSIMVKGKINPLPLNLKLDDFEVKDKKYDGKTNADLVLKKGAKGYDEDGLHLGDYKRVWLTIRKGAAVYKNSDAGNDKQVYIGDVTKFKFTHGNYYVNNFKNNDKMGNLKGNITPLPLNLELDDFEVSDKKYDGKKEATLVLKKGAKGYDESGLLTGDRVLLTIGSGAGVYKDSDAGNDKQVYIGDVTKFKFNNGNYYVNSFKNNEKMGNLKGKITPLPLNINLDDFKVNDKKYDGKKEATLVLKKGAKGYDKSGLLGGNDRISLTIGKGAAVYKDSDAGNDKQVYIGDVTKFKFNSGNYYINNVKKGDRMGNLRASVTSSGGSGSSSGSGGGAGASGGGGGGGGGAGLILLAGIPMIMGMGGGAKSSPPEEWCGRDGCSSSLNTPMDSIFNTVLYAKINGINMKAIFAPKTAQQPTKKAFVFQAKKSYKTAHKTTFIGKYNMALLGKNIIQQKVIPLNEWDEDTTNSIKEIFINQT